MFSFILKTKSLLVAQGTVISPWIVTAEALQPFMCPAPKQDPPPLVYLQEKNRSTFDIQLQASIQPKECPTAFVTSRSRFRDLHWTFAQMVAHHTLGGCNLQSGDILGSGTISSSVCQPVLIFWLIYRWVQPKKYLFKFIHRSKVQVCLDKSDLYNSESA